MTKYFQSPTYGDDPRRRHQSRVMLARPSRVGAYVAPSEERHTRLECRICACGLLVPEDRFCPRCRPQAVA